jgi:hypothetical protein
VSALLVCWPLIGDVYVCAILYMPVQWLELLCVSLSARGDLVALTVGFVMLFQQKAWSVHHCIQVADAVLSCVPCHMLQAL